MHTFFRQWRRSLTIVAVIMLAHSAWTYEINPLGIVMTREHPPAYQPGETIEITVIVNAAVQTPARAMGVREMLPEGWTFVAARGYGDETPGLLPPVGAGPELEFAWIVAPYLPYAFSYTVAIPERDGGDKTIFGAVEYRLDDGPHFSVPVITMLSGPEEIAPVILLRGANPMRIVQGTVWRDPGYTALDHNDMDISSLVTVTGSLDTGTPGDYRLVYEVVAEDSGLSARAERVVHVVAEAAASPNTEPLPPPMAPEDSTPSADALPDAMPPPDQSHESQPRHEARVPVPSSVNTAREFPDLSPYRPITSTEMEEARQTDSTEITDEEGPHAESMDDGGLPVREPPSASEAAYRETVEKEAEGRAIIKDKEIGGDLAFARPVNSADRVGMDATRLQGVAAKQRGSHRLIKVGVMAVGVLLAAVGWRWAYGARSQRGRRASTPKK